MLVYAGAQTEVSGETKHGHVEYNLHDPSLVSFLYNAELVSSDYSIYQSNPGLVEVMKEHVLLTAISGLDEKVEYTLMNKNQKKGLINRLVQDGLLPDIYFDFERFHSQMKDSAKLSGSDISESLRPYLLHPSMGP